MSLALPMVAGSFFSTLNITKWKTGEIMLKKLSSSGAFSSPVTTDILQKKGFTLKTS